MTAIRISVAGAVVLQVALGAGTVVQSQSAAPVTRQFLQQGSKLFGSGAVGEAWQGVSVSLSGDGALALIGGSHDNNNAGAVWIWIRTGAGWTQLGSKLVAADAIGNAQQGSAVALSRDGQTALIGGDLDNDSIGAAWVWTRTNGVWTQQAKLVGTGATGPRVYQGGAVALSSDGNTALVGGTGDDGDKGAMWIWTRSGGVWTQQGPKLVAAGTAAGAQQGFSVSLSDDGNTAIVGAIGDAANTGAAFVWTRIDGVWTQQGTKLIASDATANAFQGSGVSLSSDGNTAIVGGSHDGANIGAAWIWTRSGGVWTQQGPKLVGSAWAGPYFVFQGSSVSLSADGNSALVGAYGDNFLEGATWVWKRTGATWTQAGPKLVGSDAQRAYQGASVSLAGDGSIALVGGNADHSFQGAAWAFVATAPFADDPLTPGVSVIKAVHVMELRARIDALRARFGIGGFGWTDPTLAAGVTAARAQHILELRQALAEAYGAAGHAVPRYTDMELTAGATIKAAHIAELRAAVAELEASP